MKKASLLLFVGILISCSIVISCSDDETDEKVDTGLAITVLERLQSETLWELEYDDEVFTSPINFEMYIEYQKFNGGINPDGLREEYYLRYKQGDTPTDCYDHLIMNVTDGHNYSIVSNDEKELVISSPSDSEANTVVYTYENGVMRYQYQELFFAPNFFPSATLTPSSVNVNSLNICP